MRKIREVGKLWMHKRREESVMKVYDICKKFKFQKRNKVLNICGSNKAYSNISFTAQLRVSR